MPSFLLSTALSLKNRLPDSLLCPATLQSGSTPLLKVWVLELLSQIPNFKFQLCHCEFPFTINPFLSFAHLLCQRGIPLVPQGHLPLPSVSGQAASRPGIYCCLPAPLLKFTLSGSGTFPFNSSDSRTWSVGLMPWLPAVLTWACSCPAHITLCSASVACSTTSGHTVTLLCASFHPVSHSVPSLSNHNHDPLASHQIPSHITWPSFPRPHLLFHLISLPWDLESLCPFDAVFSNGLNLPLRRYSFSPGLSYLLSPLLFLGWQRKLSFHAQRTHYKIILTLSLLFGNLIHFS